MSHGAAPDGACGPQFWTVPYTQPFSTSTVMANMTTTSVTDVERDVVESDQHDAWIPHYRGLMLTMQGKAAATESSSTVRNNAPLWKLNTLEFQIVVPAHLITSTTNERSASDSFTTGAANRRHRARRLAHSQVSQSRLWSPEQSLSPPFPQVQRLRKRQRARQLEFGSSVLVTDFTTIVPEPSTGTPTPTVADIGTTLSPTTLLTSPPTPFPTLSVPAAARLTLFPTHTPTLAPTYSPSIIPTTTSTNSSTTNSHDPWRVQVFMLSGNYFSQYDNATAWTLIADTSLVPLTTVRRASATVVIPTQSKNSTTLNNTITARSLWTTAVIPSDQWLLSPLYLPMAGERLSLYVRTAQPILAYSMDPSLTSGEEAPVIETSHDAPVTMLVGSGVVEPGFPAYLDLRASGPQFAGTVHYQRNTAVLDCPADNSTGTTFTNVTFAFSSTTDGATGSSANSSLEQLNLVGAAVNITVWQALLKDDGSLLSNYQEQYHIHSRQGNSSVVTELVTDSSDTTGHDCVSIDSSHTTTGCEMMVITLSFQHDLELSSELLQHAMYSLDHDIGRAVRAFGNVEYVGYRDVTARYSLILSGVTDGTFLDPAAQQFFAQRLTSFLNDAFFPPGIKVLNVTVDEQGYFRKSRRRLDGSTRSYRQLQSDSILLSIEGEIRAVHMSYIGENIFEDAIRSALSNATGQFAEDLAYQSLIPSQNLGAGQLDIFYDVNVVEGSILLVPRSSNAPTLAPTSATLNGESLEDSDHGASIWIIAGALVSGILLLAFTRWFCFRKPWSHKKKQTSSSENEERGITYQSCADRKEIASFSKKSDANEYEVKKTRAVSSSSTGEQPDPQPECAPDNQQRKSISIGNSNLTYDSLNVGVLPSLLGGSAEDEDDDSSFESRYILTPCESPTKAVSFVGKPNLPDSHVLESKHMKIELERKVKHDVNHGQVRRNSSGNEKYSAIPLSLKLEMGSDLRSSHLHRDSDDSDCGDISHFGLDSKSCDIEPDQSPDPGDVASSIEQLEGLPTFVQNAYSLDEDDDSEALSPEMVRPTLAMLARDPSQGRLILPGRPPYLDDSDDDDEDNSPICKKPVISMISNVLKLDVVDMGRSAVKKSSSASRTRKRPSLLRKPSGSRTKRGSKRSLSRGTGSDHSLSDATDAYSSDSSGHSSLSDDSLSRKHQSLELSEVYADSQELVDPLNFNNEVDDRGSSMHHQMMTQSKAMRKGVEEKSKYERNAKKSSSGHKGSSRLILCASQELNVLPLLGAAMEHASSTKHHYSKRDKMNSNKKTETSDVPVGNDVTVEALDLPWSVDEVGSQSP